MTRPARTVFRAGGITATHPHKKQDLMRLNVPTHLLTNCNDDACLMAEEEGIIIICDGIGALRANGIDGFQLPVEVVREAVARRIRNLKPWRKEELPTAIYQMLAEREQLGATTVMLAYIADANHLQTFNMGDSGWILLRGDSSSMHIAARSRETSTVALQPGDVLIGYTDGMSDNVSDEEVIQIAREWRKEAEETPEGDADPNKLAHALTKRAFKRGCKYAWDAANQSLYDPNFLDLGFPPRRPDWTVPFVEEFARRNPTQDGRLQPTGGKPDDVTISVCILSPAPPKPRNEYRRSSGVWTIEAKDGRLLPYIPTDTERYGLKGNATNEALIQDGYGVGVPRLFLTSNPELQLSSPQQSPREVHPRQSQQAPAPPPQQAPARQPQQAPAPQPQQAPAPQPQQPVQRRRSTGGVSDHKCERQQPRKALTFPLTLLEGPLEECLDTVIEGVCNDPEGFDNLFSFLHHESDKESEKESSGDEIESSSSQEKDTLRHSRSLGSSQVPKPQADEELPIPEAEDTLEENAQGEITPPTPTGPAPDQAKGGNLEDTPRTRMNPLDRARTWLKRRRSQQRSLSSVGEADDTNNPGPRNNINGFFQSQWQRVRRRFSGSSEKAGGEVTPEAAEGGGKRGRGGVARVR
uniref:Protein phosphatase n=1 Tax=Chromera velia CCMP2878 TaxID=1169474 RepID=A0A0G4FND2_9ALVE|eukprot:Cvel_17841.t1-p1 / transcript=Cvel_17841.t1 / gene=Cvel_17841 / organism=Chromera_velia_CCMP2878 / gene_product=Protein phosphatase PTC7 homolog, putative / transcript_product=Protein phosphatase PTC7 homolog, putative / location=Cvel_scaffold1446:27524-31696(+) / protein_length=638 / sequence_SO=supercontig / SO=protein_coding / is_pseudo=false